MKTVIIYINYRFWCSLINLYEYDKCFYYTVNSECMQLFSQSKFGVIRGKGNYKLKDVIKKNILWTLKNVVISEIVVIKGH